MLQAIIYGLAQGLTEFLPVSSSGHLALLHAFFGTDGGGGDLAFDVALHLATAAAILTYFRKDITRMIFVAFRMLGRLPVDARDRTLLWAVVVGVIPAGLAGLLLEDIVTGIFRAPVFVALVLLAGSAYLAYAERCVRGAAGAALTVRIGFLIGVAQILALFPGFSRSGATIGAGMMLGLSRHDAARFSFLLALPLILAAGALQVRALLLSDAPVAWNMFGWGAAAAFVSGLLIIRFLLRFLQTRSLYPFIWYRVALATLVLGVVALRYFGG